MADIPKAVLDLFMNPKTAKFAETLRHSKLPEGWANDPEIVGLAERAWQEAGTESPFFKAWFGKSKILKGDDPRVMHHMTYADDLHVFDKARQNPGKYGRGFYFSEYPEPIYGNIDVPVYLKSEKPAEVAANRKTKPNIKKLQEQEYTGVSIPEKGYQTVFEPEQIKSVNNRGTFNPADPNIYRSLAPLGIGAGTLAAAGMLPDDAEAAAMRDPVAAYRAITGKEPSEGVADTWNPVESLLLAPIGAATTGARAASVGIDALLSALLGG